MLIESKGEKPFTKEEIVKIITNIAIGLNVMHIKGLHHRDLKPGNILVHKLADYEYL